MAKKRTLRGTAPAERHREKHGERQLNVDLPGEVVTALKKYAKKEGTKVKVVAAKAIIRYLVREGAMRS